MQPGIIAGGGKLPLEVIAAWEKQGFTPTIAAIDGFVESDSFSNKNAKIFSIGSAGAIINYLKKNNVTDLVIAGRVARPEFSKIKIDLKGLHIIIKILLKKKIGDDVLLRLIRNEIENAGFKVRGAQEFVPDILMPEGLLTDKSISQESLESIKFGLKEAQSHGLKDLGQSIVVQDQVIIAKEDEKGTSALIRRVVTLEHLDRSNLILVKACKPQQDKFLDLPTVGLETMKALKECGFSGIALQANETILLDRMECIEFCNRNNLFLYGATP